MRARAQDVIPAPAGERALLPHHCASSPMECSKAPSHSSPASHSRASRPQLSPRRRLADRRPPPACSAAAPAPNRPTHRPACAPRQPPARPDHGKVVQGQAGHLLPQGQGGRVPGTVGVQAPAAGRRVQAHHARGDPGRGPVRGARVVVAGAGEPAAGGRGFGRQRRFPRACGVGGLAGGFFFFLPRWRCGSSTTTHAVSPFPCSSLRRR